MARPLVPLISNALALAGPADERAEAAFDFGLEILIAGLHSRLQSTVL